MDSNSNEDQFQDDKGQDLLATNDRDVEDASDLKEDNVDGENKKALSEPDLQASFTKLEADLQSGADVDEAELQKEIDKVQKELDRQQQALAQKAAQGSGDKLYCLCKKPYDDTLPMIGCDGCDEWYHLGCVGLTTPEAVCIEHYICEGCSETGSRQKKNTVYKTLDKIKSEVETIQDPQQLNQEIKGLEILIKKLKELGGDDSHAGRPLSDVVDLSGDIAADSSGHHVQSLVATPKAEKKQRKRGRKPAKNSNRKRKKKRPVATPAAHPAPAPAPAPPGSGGPVGGATTLVGGSSSTPISYNSSELSPITSQTASPSILNSVSPSPSVSSSPVAGSLDCLVCGGQEGPFVTCGNCPRTFHGHCLNPPIDLSTLDPAKPWFCPRCKTAVKASTPVS